MESGWKKFNENNKLHGEIEQTEYILWPFS
jgi:hypothetical protein